MPKRSKHPHVSWRAGRPRFSPGAELRHLGYKGQDLRHPDGRWFTRGEAVDWSDSFCRKLAQERREEKAPLKSAKPVRASAYTVASLFADWYASPKFRPGEKKSYAPKTIKDYRQKARIVEDDHPLVWNAPAASLKRPHLRAVYEEIWAKRGLASARGAMLTLSSAISWGILRGKVKRADNPALGLKMEVPDPRVRFATRTEFEALVAAADHVGRPEIGDMCYLGVWTGQRQADRLALQARAVVNGRRIFRQAKTGAIVPIRVVRELKLRLEAANKRRRAARAQALLAAKTAEEREKVEERFSYAVLDEKRYVPFRSFHYTHTFAKVRDVAVAGVADKETGEWILKPCKSLADFWEMDLRDTAVVWMALAGGTIPEIVSVTGHELESATRILKHYLARHPEMADSVLAKMMAWYDAGGETEIGF